MAPLNLKLVPFGTLYLIQNEYPLTTKLEKKYDVPPIRLSSEEIKTPHKGASPVSQDFLPEEAEMKKITGRYGFPNEPPY